MKNVLYTIWMIICLVGCCDDGKIMAKSADPISIESVTLDTVYETNPDLVKLIDPLYQYVRAERYNPCDIDVNLEWMARYRSKLGRYYDNHKLGNDSVDEYSKADTVMAHAMRLYELQTVSLKFQETYLVKNAILNFKHYNALAELMSYSSNFIGEDCEIDGVICEGANPPNALKEEFKAWNKLAGQFSEIYCNCVTLKHWDTKWISDDTRRILKAGGINAVLSAHIALYKKELHGDMTIEGAFVDSSVDFLLDCCKKAVAGGFYEPTVESDMMWKATERLIEELPKLIAPWIEARNVWVNVYVQAGELMHYYYPNTASVLMKMASVISNKNYLGVEF